MSDAIACLRRTRPPLLPRPRLTPSTTLAPVDRRIFFVAAGMGLLLPGLLGALRLPSRRALLPRLCAAPFRRLCRPTGLDPAVGACLSLTLFGVSVVGLRLSVRPGGLRQRGPRRPPGAANSGAAGRRSSWARSASPRRRPISVLTTCWRRRASTSWPGRRSPSSWSASDARAPPASSCRPGSSSVSAWPTSTPSPSSRWPSSSGRCSAAAAASSSTGGSWPAPRSRRCSRSRTCGGRPPTAGPPST